MSTTYSIPSSVQEAAAQFANNVLAMVNNAAAEIAGVEVMWFRAMPDKRSQDVIFQSYTLYGVEDCPLTFKAVYSDTGYDDAALTFNILGIDYSVPLTLDIPCDTWYKVTNFDGTLPQRGDIVFIPLSNKLVEVVSMKPVKSVAAQITAFKVNCSVYKPTRSRIVGENLKTSIEENTVNLDSRFGKDIEETLKNIVDDNQLSIYASTQEDPHKKITKTSTAGSLLTDSSKVNCIKAFDLIADGHIVARTHYDMNQNVPIIVTYKTNDDIVKVEDERCLSCWVNIKEHSTYRNVKSISYASENGESFLDIMLSAGKKEPIGTSIILERGNLVICGTIVDIDGKYRIKISSSVVKSLNKAMPNWLNVPGYIIRKDNPINLLSADSDDGNLELYIKGNNYISFTFGEKEMLCQLSQKLKSDKWYGFVINLGSTFSVDVYESDPELKKIYSVTGLKNKLWKETTYKNYKLKSSPSLMTNIRYYSVGNLNTDKQITDLVSFNCPFDAYAIINDSPDMFLNKPFVGIP